ncbi:MAG TPA: hypothetical protein VEU09_00390 [Candidatus Binatia bacterium]|nr:hypothetical protein [Candidatus Binatia bacterium]
MSDRARLCSLALRFAGAIFLVGFLFPQPSQATNRTVGSGRTYSTVRAAVTAAAAGDSILIYSGTYALDHFTSSKPLHFLGIGATKPVMDGQNDQANGIDNAKGIWTFTNGSGGTTVDNIEFKNAANPNANGCGVRIDGGTPGSFTIANSYFHDCQMEILAAPQTLLITRCELYHSTHTEVGCEAAPTCYEHCIYVNTSYTQSFTIEYSYVHQADTGNEVKSRAQNTYILYNRLADEDAIPSYTIDIPDGGRAYIIGNVVEQGPNSSNSNIISYAAESAGNGTLDLYVVNNTIVNDKSTGTFINVRAGTTAKVLNNIFYGPGNLMAGGIFAAAANLQTSSGAGFLSPGPPNYDYHLTASTPTTIVGAGLAPGTSVVGYLLTPAYQYVYDEQFTTRSPIGSLDLGAFEYTGGTGGQDLASPSAVRDLRYR